MISVTKDGVQFNDFEFDHKTFSTNGYGLVIVCIEDGITFNTGHGCVFITGSRCTFNTESNCTFKTGSYCKFMTGYDCVFNTGRYCEFTTNKLCTFRTGPYCNFTTGSGCTFNTADICIFTTGSGCTFNTNSGCEFTTEFNCVGIRHDINGIIEIPSNKTIKYYTNGISGFSIVESKKKTVTLELTDEQLDVIKKMLEV